MRMKKTLLAALLLMASLGAGAQRIEVEKPLIDCGQVRFRQPVSVLFQLRNTGNKPLHINKVLTSCGCTAVDYPRQAIESNASFTLRATYDAKAMGHFTKLIGVYSDGSDKPITLTLRGKVVEEVVEMIGNYPYKLGDLSAETNDVEFDDVNKADRPYQRFHIFNSGAKPVEPVVMHLPNYLQAEVSPSHIAPGKGGTVTLLLDPRNLKDFGLTQTSVYLGMFPGDRVSAEKEISVSAVLLPNFETLTDAQRLNAPRAELSTDTLDFGSFNGRKSVKGEVLIHNTGRSELKIRSLQMFTSGIEVSLNRTSIQPGETAKLKVKAIASRLRYVRTKPRVLIITNDPERPKVVINIQVNP